LFGLYTLIGISTAHRVTASGTVSNLSQVHGKGNNSDFDVRRSDGTLVQVQSSYSGDHVQNGQTVTVEILSFRSTLLHLHIDAGPWAGWDLRESADSWIGWYLVTFAAVILLWARKRDVASGAHSG
jgi:hypothetical protein